MGKKSPETSRQAAFKVLHRVTSTGSYADILIEREFQGLDERERPLATEIVYGVLRWQMKIDWIIGSFSGIKVKKLEDRVLTALRIGIYQIYFLSGVPDSAAVNEAVNLLKPSDARKRGFVNAVLRKAASDKDAPRFPALNEDPAGHVSIVYSHPEWMVRRWIKRYGVEEAIEICKANLAVPAKFIRTNTLKLSRDLLLKELADEGFDVKKTVCSPDGVEILGGRGLSPKDARYYIQDEASQLIPYLLRPAPGEIVLDACSAPGGKATHMAQIMKNRGSIYALDRHSSRLRAVEESARRFGIGIIKALEADAASPLEFAPHEGFDAILCDSPCSGLGVLRRSPEIKSRRKEDDLLELSSRQRLILNNLSRHLKKGGRLVYSTCTSEPEETDMVIRDFLSEHGDFILEGAGGYVPEVCKGLVDSSGLFRTYPHRHRMDGFFGARLKKIL